MLPDFDQFVEYVTEGPIIHAVELDQHSLDSVFTVEAVVGGFKHAGGLGRPLLAGEAELALVFSEWTAESGLPSPPGLVASALLAPWPAKSVAAAYVVATSGLLDAINQSRTVAVALIRMSIQAENGGNPLAPREPFTSAQVTALATWLNEHNITNAEFAALFNVSAAQLSNWLTSHPRWQFAQVLHDQFT